MKTRMVIFTLLLLLALGLAATAAASSPPWPATVIHDTDYCSEISWPSSWDPYETWLPVPGTGIEVQQIKNGLVKITCHAFVDFDNEDYLSMEAACQDPGWYDWLCKGPNTLVNTQWECGLFWNGEWYPSKSAIAVVTQAGQATMTCVFRVPTAP